MTRIVARRSRHLLGFVVVAAALWSTAPPLAAVDWYRTVAVRRSTGTGFGAHEAWTDGAYRGDRGTFFADVTGDRRADAIVVNTNWVTVRPSNGTRFVGNAAWTDGPYLGDRGIFFADATGDGKADAIVVNNNWVTVRPSNGSRFVGNAAWTDGPFWGERGTFFADVTGDGKADAIAVNSNWITVRPSNGKQFVGNAGWTGSPYYGSLGTFFADVTGDGRADAIAVNDTEMSVRRSNGTRFLDAQNWTKGSYYGSVATAFADLTGDRKAEAIVVNDLMPRTVRVHAVRVANDDGTRRARITPQQVQLWVARANDVFATGKIRFEFAADANAGDWTDLRSSLINRMTAGRDATWEAEKHAANAEAAKHPGKVTVFFRWGVEPSGGPTGGGFSAGPEHYNFVMMPGFDDTRVCGNQNITLFAHELGHYFGLRHTFPRVYKSVGDAEQHLIAHGNSRAAFDGDGFTDTQPDPVIEMTGCGSQPASLVLNGLSFTLPRTNVMSYYNPQHSVASEIRTLSVQQMFRVHAAFGVRFPY